MGIEKEKLYIRQTTLAEVGHIGQDKLLASKIAIVGCGGLGSAAAVYLAASGIGHIHLIDYDKIDVSNLHRQVFYTTDEIGNSKAKSLANHIQKISPFVKVSIHEKPLKKANVNNQLEGYPIVVDCTDSLPTKYLLNDYCVLKGKILIYGSLYKHDGYVSAFNVPLQKGFSAHLRDAFPDKPQKHVPNCSEIGTLNPIVGMIGLMQANEVIKVITGIGKNLTNKLLIYNSLENTQFTMNVKPSFPREKLASIFEKEHYFDASCEVQDEDLLIESELLRKKLSDQKIHIVSVIGDEHYQFPFEIDLIMPNSKFDVAKIKPLLHKEIVVVCQKGISSYEATKKIKKAFPESMVSSLKYGVNNF